MKSGSLLTVASDRLRRLPTGIKVGLGVAVLTVLGVASVLMYQVYDYVQHDNQFCLECHLMQDPFERFAQSAHRGLGCKACHRPSIIERSEMGLAQIVVNPDTIRVHAHVPNDVCAECHIEGDPERWRMIANTAGHRVHLESDDPALQGLNCVECHSSGVHEFTPTDKTCGQGGCHETTRVQLGEMADITIHCATCHEFARPTVREAGAEQVAAALRPQAAECMSCHQMRALLPDLPPDEPHDGNCSVCHNPHDQRTPAEAVQTCATGGCHSTPEELTPFHRGMDVGVLENCTACHEAHRFRIHQEGQNCLECHSDIYQDAPGTRISGTAAPVRLASAGSVEPGLIRLALASHSEPPAAAQDTVRFWHAQHRGVDCTACHSMQRTHGGLTVTSLADCRSCHHTQPVAGDCSACHDRSEVRRLRISVRRTMDIRLGTLNRPTRTLPFDHGVHGDAQCTRCHTAGVALSAATVNCAGCHQDHHQPTTQCRACHAPPSAGAHDLQVHLGCAGSACHAPLPTPIQNVPRTRDFCLVCHQDLTAHRPGQNCATCHSLPRPRADGAQTGTGPHLAQP